MKCKNTYSTKACGEEGDEDHELAQPSMSLSSCANWRKKKESIYGVFQGRNAKCCSGDGLPQHPGYPSTMGFAPSFYLQKMVQKMIMNHFPLVFSEPESGEGVKPLG